MFLCFELPFFANACPQGRKASMSLAPSIEISFIHKNPRNDPFHPILYVGGYLPFMWHCDMRTAAQMEKDGAVQFYVQDGMRRIKVKAEYGASTLLHLRTVPDGLLTNNLLNLLEFPPFYGLRLAPGGASLWEALQSSGGAPAPGLISGFIAGRRA